MATPTVATHSDDVHRLLAALTSEPSFVFGSSIGALIGLDLVTQHPEQVRGLVAHEPPVWELLPDAERDRAIRSLEDIVETFRREGSNAALQEFSVFAAVDRADREPDVLLPRPSPQIEANMNFFFTNDALGVNHFRLDSVALRGAATRIRGGWRTDKPWKPSAPMRRGVGGHALHDAHRVSRQPYGLAASPEGVRSNAVRGPQRTIHGF